MKQQRGGTILGFIIGVVVGLAVALAVAVYVTKVPVPFMNKSQSRSAEQNEAETKKNNGWDPNAALYGKNPAKTAAPAVPAPEAQTAAPAAQAKPDAKAPTKANAKPEAKPDSKGELKPAVSADPLGDLVKAKSAAAAAPAAVGEPFVYFVQLGAFRSTEDAEGFRAKLSLSGIESKVSEREQSGRTVYRVRVGPFEKKEDADRAKEKLDKSGLDTALVRVQH